MNNEIKQFIEQFKHFDFSVENSVNLFIDDVKDFVVFFDKNINNNLNNSLNNSLNIIQLTLLHNDLYNYAYHMLQKQYFESYLKQKDLLENKAFENLIKNHSHFTTIKNSLLVKLCLTILCYKFVLNNNELFDRQEIGFNYKNYIIELNNNNNKSEWIVFVNSFDAFCNNDVNISKQYLKQICFDEDKKMKFTGYSNDNSYLTYGLPDEFKNIIFEL